MLRSLIVTSILLHILNADEPFKDGTPFQDGTPLRDDTSTPETEEKLSPVQQLGAFWQQVPKVEETHCLTGYMTDVQSWVGRNGDLNPRLHDHYFIDVSSTADPVTALREKMQKYRRKVLGPAKVKYLSLAKCKLRRVPSVFHLRDSRGRTLYSTVEYLTLYGNEFITVSGAGFAFTEEMNATDAVEFADTSMRWPGSPAWAIGLQHGIFENLRELDLRKCNIQRLVDDIFANMPKLEALYLGENQISQISTNTFRGLDNLLHLDLSRNFYYNTDPRVDVCVNFENTSVFRGLRKLRSLDLSMTVMSQREIDIFLGLSNLTRLSICDVGIFSLPKGMFNNSRLKILDLSCNTGILSGRRPLEGLENTLEVLYARQMGLRSFGIFRNFEKLEVLNVEGNEIGDVPRLTTKSLKNLRILNLNKNRLIAWFDMVYSYMKNLQLLSLKENNINVITPEMLIDMQNISYIGLSGNFFVCNCQSRELFDIAYKNDNKTTKNIYTNRKEYEPYSFHTGFDDFNQQVESRKNLVRYCEGNHCESDEKAEIEGNFQLIDFQDNEYLCLLASESETIIPFSQFNTCAQMKRDSDYLDVIADNRHKLLALIVIPVLVFPVLIFCYIFRRNLRYFCITIKNSAMLSLIHKHEIIDDGTIFHYDVFVSYCNNDRNWILDEFIPNVEKGCNINVCLHERDFQVGLSILENIVSCMDRSRSIMLVISKQFLLSQWCQFEMHLAQHRLLETRREDLILVLLEDIPRRLRPTTLHYLMLTKTYIIWPKKESEHQAFWKRLSRSILARRTVSQSNNSEA
ncbi:leucine rich repeat domain-containing protein [Phthorimaea operculella]|nr:leucine rich repeat domain-containing protein [Phthorimaea operculella]